MDLDLHSSWTSKDSKLTVDANLEASDDEDKLAHCAAADTDDRQHMLSATLAETLLPHVGEQQQGLPAAISISPRGPMLEAMWEQAAAAEVAHAMAHLAPADSVQPEVSATPGEAGVTAGTAAGHPATSLLGASHSAGLAAEADRDSATDVRPAASLQQRGNPGSVLAFEVPDRPARKQSCLGRLAGESRLSLCLPCCHCAACCVPGSRWAEVTLNMCTLCRCLLLAESQ